MYAVIESGGKQFRVAAGDVIEVEKLKHDQGSEVHIDRVLLVSSEQGVTVGAPLVEGARVRATVAEHFRGPKIVVFKMKPKKRYRRKMGHRQSLTRLKIEAIEVA